MTIKHPAGSEQFGAELAKLGAPAPWRLCDEVVGEVLAADGEIVLSADTRATEEASSALALLIVCAVNTLAGFRAEAPQWLWTRR